MSESYVLDASAILCPLQDENGADRVVLALPNAQLSAVNYSEVVGKLVEDLRGSKASLIGCSCSGVGQPSG